MARPVVLPGERAILNNRCVQEGIFDPGLSVQVVDWVEEALELANSTA